MSNKIAILGGGSFGITCSILTSKNNEVILYARNEKNVIEINSNHTLKGRKLPKNIVGSSDLEFAIKSSEIIVPVIPSSNFRSLLKQASNYISEEHCIIHATKGLECIALKLDTPLESIKREDIKTMSQVIVEETGNKKVGCLAGPNLASEIIEGQPATAVIASAYDEVIDKGRKAFDSSVFKVFGSYNRFGIELAGAFKNTIAIASGILAGLHLGKNMQAACITKGWHEIIRVSMFIGAKKEAFFGIAGMGDLIATATSTASRNYSFGQMLAQGLTLEEILDKMDEVAEGVYTLKILYALIKKHKISAPVCTMIYKLVYEGYDAEKAIPALMRIPFSLDVEF